MAARACPFCGGELKAEVLGGLCPRCVLKQASANGAHPPEPHRDDHDASPDAAETPATRHSPPVSPARFGDYELLEKVAEGGMGVVYRARQLSLNRVVAVKMIQPGRVGSPEMVLRFRAEAEAAASLHHPNIVPIHETGECEGQHFFSMDFIAGQNLAEAVREGPLPLAHAAQLVAKIAAAVHHAHQHQILHRDLKPSNVILDATGEPQVTDFGLARRLGGDSTLTLTGQVFGSPRFMPPEQASGRPGAVGVHSDVYGLGAILYYLLTARPPFVGETMETTLAQVLEQEPVSPRLLNASVPRDLETICLKCLDKEPSRRYASAQAVADELGRFLDKKPILARPVGLAGKAGRWCRRKPALAMALGAVVLVAAVGFVGILTQWRQAQAQRDAAVQARIRSDQERYDAAISEAQLLIEQNRFDRAQEILAREQRESYRGWEWGWLQRLCNLDLMTFARTNELVCLAFSPDGRYLATAGFHGTASVFDLETGREVCSLPGHRDTIFSVVFSPDGKQLVTGSYDGTTRVWDVATAQGLLVLTNGDKVVGAVFSPDGEIIATAGLSGGLKLWDAKSGSLLPKRFDLEQPATALAFSPDGRRIACAAGPWVFDADADATLNIFDLNSGLHQSFKTHRKGIVRVCFSPDGRCLATAGLDGTARVWDVETGTEVEASRVVFGPDAVREVAFSPNGQWLAVCTSGWVGGAKIFEVGTGRLVRSLDGHSIGVTAIGFSPDGSKLATASYDGTARIWSAPALPEFLSLEGHDQPVWVIAFSPDGKRLASGSFDQTARVWDAETGDSLTVINVGFPVVSLAFSPEGDRLVTVGPDHTACIWPVQTNREPSDSPPGFGVRQPSAALASEPRQEREIVEKAPEDWRTPRRLRGHTGTVMAVAWSANGQWILTGSKDGTACLWDATTGTQLRKVHCHTNWVLNVAFSPEGRRFVTAGRDRTTRIWEVDTGRSLAALTGDSDWVQQVAFSPDGRQVATGDRDRRVRLWDADTGRLLLTLEGHRSGISSLAFSPDGARLATAGGGVNPLGELSKYDRSTILWDLHTGHRLLKLDAHFSWVLAVAFSPDGRRLATGSLDNTVRIRESFPWKSRDYPGGPHATLAEQTEAFKRGHWRDRMRSASWAVPLGTRPLQPGRRLDYLYSIEVNLPAQPAAQCKPVAPLPRREPHADANLVDLSASYNAALNETWQPSWRLLDVDQNLSSLPPGVHRLAGVPFDMRGIIRLRRSFFGYAIFPTQVEIAVARKFRRLHLLHGADSSTKDGTQIGTYRLHYRDGGSAELRIVYGRDVLDWRASGEGAPQGMEAEVAWTGTDDQTQPTGTQARLFKRTYENPAPGREVTRITFESAVTGSGPFLLAMTVEP